MSSSSKSRYIPLRYDTSTLQDLKKADSHRRQDIASTLVRDVQLVLSGARSTSVNKHDTVYTGLSGIAFMGYHIAKMRHLPLQNPALSSGSLMTSADKILARVLRRNPTLLTLEADMVYSPNRLSFIETRIGVATLILSRGHSSSEHRISDNWQAAKDYLNWAMQQTLTRAGVGFQSNAAGGGDQEDGQCEVLYGRAGLIYAVLYLRKSVHAHPAEQREGLGRELEPFLSDIVLTNLVDSIIERGKHGARILSTEFRAHHGAHVRDLPPLMWKWHGRYYLGAAHGVAGILHILLLCPKPVIDRHMPDILSAVSWLIDCQQYDGNWPTKCPTQSTVSSSSDLIQWCHGAPGILILLSTVLRVLSHQSQIQRNEALVRKLNSALLRGADVVYQQGLLRKGVGLCHGVAGSVYALLAVSDVVNVKGEEFLLKAAHLACLSTLHEAMTISKEMRIPDHPWSLYEGLAGACCVWAEILSRLDSARFRRASSGFPGFDDLL